ncbi:MAG: hypothetical protein Q8N81_04225 [bacterium]|nr:hypothetical protein [bacterium]
MANKIIPDSSKDLKRKEIQRKIGDLKKIMRDYHVQMNSLEKEVLQVIGDYRKTLEKKKIKEIRKYLSEIHG